MFHKVEKPFSGGGVDRLRGEAIDPDAWRNGRRLVDQRFISAGALGIPPISCACGRQWFGDIPDHPCTDTSLVGATRTTKKAS